MTTENLNLLKTGVAALFLFVQCETFAQINTFPYTFKKFDYAVLPISAALNFGAGYLSDNTDFYLTINEIEALDRSNVNRFDRPATYNWNRQLNNTSDVFSAALPIIPAVLIIPNLIDQQWQNAAVFGVMYFETYYLTKGITVLTKSLSLRTRPYMYNTDFTPDQRLTFQGTEAPEAKSSFFSGHTSGAFASAVFLAKAYTDMYGKSAWSKLVWTGAVGAASFTAYCRVAAGEHFTSDVIVGALVGGAIGYMIPEIHRTKNEKLSLTVLPQYLSLRMKF